MTNILVATSCLTNALLGGKRYEMLSSRAYRCELGSQTLWEPIGSPMFWSPIRKFLDRVFGEDHCQKCYEFERDNFDGIQD